ncbi:MAG: hypothetical protein IJE59_04295 [Clostridia bacterium]|nr:hypothetical protein [Clostridia bacterium]
MSRKLNACTKKKLKRSLWVLVVLFVFTLSLTTSYISVQKDVASSDEMKNSANTLESIYTKLDSEEIKFLSEDGSETLSYSIPNKEFGRVTISGDSDDNLIILYDYQKPEMYCEFIFMTLAFTVWSLFVVLCMFFSIKGLVTYAKNKKLSKKEQKKEKTEN